MNIEIYGKYYYRDEYHIPHRITIVASGSTGGFFWYVDGHLSKEEIESKSPQRKLIHQNRITM